MYKWKLSTFAQHFQMEEFSIYWNTVQVVNCTIQNTQAICLWNVKKALNFFCYCPNVVAFWGVKRWSWRSGTAAIRVSRLEKVSKNLLLKKFQSIGSCPIARVFWYLRNNSWKIIFYLWPRNFETQMVFDTYLSYMWSLSEIKEITPIHFLGNPKSV